MRGIFLSIILVLMRQPTRIKRSLFVIFETSLIILILFSFQSSILKNFTYAATDTNTLYSPANYYPIGTSNIREGEIVSFTDGTYALSKTPGDQFMVGVITANPAITQDIQGPIPFYPVVATGQGQILVTTSNGPIKKGDFITSSTISGIGQKASAPGYTIGVALSDYTASNPKTIGKIPISLNIHYFIGNANIRSSLLDIFALSTLATYEQPSLVFKYVLAGGIVALALLFAFVLISRTANKGIDALGRNPLSSTEIHIGMALNVFIAIVILATGFVMGFLVLRL